MEFVTIRGIGVLIAIVACAISCGFSVLAADEEPAPAESPFNESSSAAGNGEQKPEIVCTSPKGTFRIETVFTKAEDPADEYEQQYIVSTADPNIREPLGEKHQAQPATYFISPDEQWIFAQVHYGSGTGGARLYQRKKDFKFDRVMDEKPIWKFFEKQALAGKKRPSDWGVESIDFIAWSPDSARVLFSLRAGKRVTGKGSLGYYDWHAYYNVRSGKSELTDYLRALNRSARKIRPEDENKEPAATAASAEPLGELPPEGESKKRYEAADRQVKELFQKLLDIQEKQLQESIRDEQTSPTQRQIYEQQLKSSRGAQSGWIDTREIGAKFYAESGPKSTAARRYWQYMADSTEARATSLKEQIGTEEH